MKNLITAATVLLISCAHAVSPLATRPAVDRNRAVDFEKLMEKYGVLPKSTCAVWESQSVVCEVNSQIVTYCEAPTGQMPTCKLMIDTRPPAETKK